MREPFPYSRDIAHRSRGEAGAAERERHPKAAEMISRLSSVLTARAAARGPYTKAIKEAGAAASARSIGGILDAWERNHLYGGILAPALTSWRRSQCSSVAARTLRARRAVSAGRSRRASQCVSSRPGFQLSQSSSEWSLEAPRRLSRSAKKSTTLLGRPWRFSHA